MSAQSAFHVFSGSPLFVHCQERAAEWQQFISDSVSGEIQLYRNGRRADLDRTIGLLLDSFFDMAHDPDVAMSMMRPIAEARARDDLSLQQILEAWRIARTSGWAFLVNANRVVVDNEALIAMWDRFQRLADAQTHTIVDVYAVQSARSTMASRETLDAVLTNPASPNLVESLKSIGITSRTVAVISSNILQAEGSLEAGKFESGIYDAFIRRLPHLGHAPPVTVHRGNLTAIIDATRFRSSDFERDRSGASALVIGVSRLDLGPEHLTVLDQQSRVALSNCHQGRRVTRFDELSLYESATTGLRTLHEDLPERFRTMAEAPRGRIDQIRKTATALLKANMRVTEAAGQLNLHSNSVYYRRNAIMEEFGIDILDVQDLMEFMIAARTGSFSSAEAAR